MDTKNIQFLMPVHIATEAARYSNDSNQSETAISNGSA